MDFETFKDNTLYWAVGAVGLLLAYLARDLKENDKKLSQDLSEQKAETNNRIKETNNRIVETNNRIAKVEDSVHQSHLILTEMKGDLKLLNNGIQVYKREKHDLANELGQYKGAMPELLKALMLAEKINDSNEKK